MASPTGNPEQIAAVGRLGILDTPPEPEYDDLVSLAAALSGCPIAMLTFVDGRRQWFKASIGLPWRETPLEESLCAHVVARGTPLQLNSVARDAQFADHPVLRTNPAIRAYLGVPIRGGDGVVMATLAVADSRARRFPAGLVERLERVARTATRLLDARVYSAEAAGELDRALRRTLEAMHDAFFTLDREWRFTFLNPQAERLLHRTRESLVGKYVWDEFPAAVDSTSRRAYEQAMASGQMVEFEDGYEPLGRWFAVRAHPSDEGLAVYFRDITARREDEARLRQLAESIDQASDAIIELDTAHRIVSWSGGAERIYGWTRDEAVGRSARELFHEDPSRFDAAVAALTVAGGWTGELEQRRKTGANATMFCRWTLMRDARGEPSAVLAINSDITERRRIEQQFLRSQRIESIGTLAGGIAHDLNNVLAPILLSIEYLRIDEHDADRLETLGTIEASARRGADMVRQVLTFARGVEGRRIVLEPAKLVEDVAKIAGDTLPKAIVVETRCDPDTWAVSGDPTQLHQVLLNLAVNSRDAMPDGGTLRLSARNATAGEDRVLDPELGAGPYVTIEVQDTGTGMAPEVLDRVFDPFFTTKPTGHGTGLGLSTSLAIVKSHGGVLRLYSEPGRGTRARIHLPAIPDASAADLAQTHADLPRGNGERILVVDDEPSVRMITRGTLEAFGYRVLEAGDGAEAVAMYARQRKEIAAVLTDMMMPVMDGAATIKVLRRLDPAVRIIAASGLSADGRVAEIAGAGVKHFLAKPYGAETLLKTLRAVLDEPVPPAAP